MERSDPNAELEDLPEPEGAVEAEGTLDLAAVRTHCVGLADAVRSGLGLPPAGSAIVAVDRPGAAAQQRLVVVTRCTGARTADLWSRASFRG